MTGSTGGWAGQSTKGHSRHTSAILLPLSGRFNGSQQQAVSEPVGGGCTSLSTAIISRALYRVLTDIPGVVTIDAFAFDVFVSLERSKGSGNSRDTDPGDGFDLSLPYHGKASF